MSPLLRAELLRLVSRRLLIVLLVCMAGLAAFGAAVGADGARPLNDQERQDSKMYWAQDKTQWEEECVDAPTSQECEGWEVPTSPEAYLRSPASFGEYAEDSMSFGLPLMLLAVGVLAVSLVGAEFSSGNIGTQLLFTPRRIPLLASKVVAVAVGGLFVAVAYLGTALAFNAIMFLSLRGASDMTAEIDLALLLGRGLLLAVLIAVMSGAIAMAVGSTLIAAGVLAVVLLGSWMLADAISGFAAVQLFLPSNILWAMVEGQHEVFGWMTTTYDSWVLAQVIGYDWALGYSVIGTAIIIVASAWWFRRRDILR